MAMNAIQKEWIETNQTDYSDLRVLFINNTLKKSPETSNTEGLLTKVRELFEAVDVKVETLRSVDYVIAPGVYPDMTKKGWEKDEWPKIFEKVMEADILILATPIWLGQASSQCQKVIERLYAHSGETNEKGQYIFYGKVGGVIITGNEDGVKHCAMGMLYSLQHIGFTISPQADAGWIGDIGPGPSYCDKGSGGPENDFTNRNTTFMVWNILHLARMLKDQKGLPAHGNQPAKWKKKNENANPEYR